MPRSLLVQRRSRANGFALPVAVGGSLLILLSSSSLQLLALQGRVASARLRQRHAIEDTLASAAQQQAAALQAAGGCLLAVELEQWAAAAPACGLDAQALQQGQLGEHRYRVSAYRVPSGGPAANTAELELQLGGERPWRAAYRLTLAPAAGEGVQITGMQELGLRGARA
jgi:hypothetical protein